MPPDLAFKSQQQSLEELNFMGLTFWGGRAARAFLNSSQRALLLRTVEGLLQRPCTIGIQGPPGTGKTTLAEVFLLIMAFLGQGNFRILVTSQMNATLLSLAQTLWSDLRLLTVDPMEEARVKQRNPQAKIPFEKTRALGPRPVVRIVAASKENTREEWSPICTERTAYRSNNMIFLQTRIVLCTMGILQSMEGQFDNLTRPLEQRGNKEPILFDLWYKEESQADPSDGDMVAWKYLSSLAMIIRAGDQAQVGHIT